MILGVLLGSLGSLGVVVTSRSIFLRLLCHLQQGNWQQSECIDILEKKYV